jgi:hypothetical protein
MKSKELLVLIIAALFMSGCNGCKKSENSDLSHAVSPSADIRSEKAEAPVLKKQPFAIMSVSPKDNEKEALFDQPVVVTFNKDFSAKDISKKIVVMSQLGDRVKGTVSCHDNILTFKPDPQFGGGQTYLIVVKKGIKSSSGDILEKDYNWRFETVLAKLPKIRVFNGDSIILSDVAGYDFFDQSISSSSDPVQFKVRNEGVKPLSVNSISFTSGDIAQFSINAPKLPVTLQPKESLVFSALFTPQSAGKKIVKVRIKNSDEDFGNFNFTMTGKGI